MDDEVLRRLMGLELGRINQGMVTQPVPLARLLADPRATAQARSGEPYAFDAAAVARLAAAAPPWLHGRLRLPITVYEPHDAPGDGYVEDAAAVEALQAMQAATTSPRGGRLWMSSALWRRQMDAYPTCFQRVHL
jgi:uncharacterized protein (UPF0216 family)